jgi:hypothetical protein
MREPISEKLGRLPSVIWYAWVIGTLAWALMIL